ncbi:MAG TPA: 16S rRNA (adenine(1518)-N(6)/adenine(1519)-N(6))-dimethyltransferase RsmA [Chitinophagales bacterium]|nr:16S rRNA (adenine(1518)-N(6)/adenine(1519)-N(6))-dimethyltransferase RsmA [Chitinophagales bacterium]
MNRQNYRLKRNGNTGWGRVKKQLGQHFLKDEQTAERIVSSLKAETDSVLEIGPGRGVLTQFLLQRFGERFHAIEIDRELIQYLSEKFPEMEGRLHNEDFLKIKSLFPPPSKGEGAWRASVERPRSIALIGNFPYNISTQIIFRVLEFRDSVKEVVGMFQKEVAKRIVANPGSKDYGIISVLLSVWYEREYLFELPPDAFTPPPQVHSAVIRLTRNAVKSMECNEELFKKIVKTAFNQRRKMLRNSLSGLMDAMILKDKIFEKRPEQLGMEEFVKIVKRCEGKELNG